MTNVSRLLGSSWRRVLYMPKTFVRDSMPSSATAVGNGAIELAKEVSNFH